MISALRNIKNLLDDNHIEYGSLIGILDNEITKLNDRIDDLEFDIETSDDYEDDMDCDRCDRYVDYIDPNLLHSDLLQLEAKYQLREVSEETYNYCKNILEKYVTM